jgi:integrase
MPKLADSMLTDQQIRRMPNPPIRVEKSDKNSGLYLIVQPSGAKSWAIRYRVERDGKLVQTRTTLGHYPGLGLADARTKARALREAADKRAAEIAAAATVAALAAPGAPAALPAPVVNSVARIWDEYCDKFLTTKQPGTAARYRREFDKNILPVWGSRAIAEIRKADVKTIVNDAEARGPEARNNILVTLKSFFGWCADADQDYVEASPVFTFTIRQQDSRDRALKDYEVAVFWKGCDELGPIFGPMFQLLLLTGARRDEVAGMRWSEINGNVWTIPGERTKNSQPFDVYLTKKALAVLATMPRMDGSPFVFTISGETYSTGYSKAKAALDKLAPLPAYTLHDLRRTFATGCATLGVGALVVDKCLNHQPKNLKGVARIYNRYAYAKEKEAAWKLWSEHVTSLAKGRSNH